MVQGEYPIMMMKVAFETLWELSVGPRGGGAAGNDAGGRPEREHVSRRS